MPAKQPTSLHIDPALWEEIGVAALRRKMRRTQAVEAALRQWLESSSVLNSEHASANMARDGHNTPQALEGKPDKSKKSLGGVPQLEQPGSEPLVPVPEPLVPAVRGIVEAYRQRDREFERQQKRLSKIEAANEKLTRERTSLEESIESYKRAVADLEAYEKRSRKSSTAPEEE